MKIELKNVKYFAAGADRLARLLDSTETHAKWGIDKILNKLPIADALAIYAKA